MVTMRRRAEGLLEGARKMIKAQIDELCERGQRNFLREMLLDEFRHALLLPRRQAATKRPRRTGCRSFQADEFVHQHEGQGLCILAATRVGIPNLGLEFERRVPDGLIEEEQARADRRAGDARFQIEQRILQIDVEIRDTRQDPRRLPSVEPMPSRHEAELAIELAQGRFWQPLDKRLAIMSFCAFVSDQQMSSSLKAVFASLTPSKLYRVRLYCPPIR